MAVRNNASCSNFHQICRKGRQRQKVPASIRATSETFSRTVELGVLRPIPLTFSPAACLTHQNWPGRRERGNREKKARKGTARKGTGYFLMGFVLSAFVCRQLRRRRPHRCGGGIRRRRGRLDGAYVTATSTGAGILRRSVRAAGGGRVGDGSIASHPCRNPWRRR